MRLFNGFFRANVAKTLFYTTPGNYSLTLGPGKYEFILRAGGGAGGEHRTTKGTHQSGGGAGGKGGITRSEITLTELKVIDLTVGAGGLTKSNGGNGGSARVSPSGADSTSGAGGGGGHASFFKINGSAYAGANGGGGGGGAGVGYLSTAGTGGGGGGYYYYNNGTETNYAGKTGADYKQDGVAGNQQFSNIYSGWGIGTELGHQAYGGGSSGGGGGYSSSMGRFVYQMGGGGAGGDTDAGGGDPNAYNIKSIPTDTTSENATYGVTGAYGRGGEPEQNGQGGFVLIRQIG
ncbi:MAG: hypothetical protein MJ156_00440 [Alphaproteobacteria bacterium]|nr:hypothetical protein [Alphaproteobacteria bacterium]